MADLEKIQSDIMDIKLSLQRLTLIQEGQARDIEHHIARTDELQNLVQKITELHQTCPARVNHVTYKNLINNIKDISIILGLIVTLLTLWGIL